MTFWPYKSTPGNRKHWFRHGKKTLFVTVTTRKGKPIVKARGNLRGAFSMPLNFTINNSEIIFE